MTVAPKYFSESASGDSTALQDKLERRMSASSIQSSKYRQRLGILCSIDLSGETMEGYVRWGHLQPNIQFRNILYIILWYHCIKIIIFIIVHYT